MKIKSNSTLEPADARSGHQIQNNPIRRKWRALALGGFLFTSMLGLSAHPAGAQCEQWDVSGKWKIRQGSFTLPVVLTQNGKTVTGSALHRDAIIIESSGPLGIGGFAEQGNLAGSVSGTVEGDRFDVQIDWARGGVGVYRGTIGKNGVIQGMTYDKKKPSSTATWRSSKVMKCADEEVLQPTDPAPPPTAPPPISKSGKAPAPTPPPPIRFSGKAKPQTSAAAPTIKVNPVLVIVPAGQSRARTTVTWDGGPDHPDAELWMKGSSQEEATLVVQQGKGTRSVTVELGQNYRFTLKDAGQELAKAAVLTKR